MFALAFALFVVSEFKTKQPPSYIENCGLDQFIQSWIYMNPDKKLVLLKYSLSFSLDSEYELFGMYISLNKGTHSVVAVSLTMLQW